MITIFKNKKDIPQDKEYIEQVKVQTSRECKVIEDYEELKEWWENEE